jgi:hypothetical protein
MKVTCDGCGREYLNNAFCSRECAKVFTSKGMRLYNSVREKKEACDRDHPLYKTWQGMKNRCFSVSNRDYGNYGGRGIMVCDRWKASFHAFVQDMGPKPTKKHTIERLNNDGNYEPSNCCWATKAEQNRNKRNVKSIRNA